MRYETYKMGFGFGGLTLLPGLTKEVGSRSNIFAECGHVANVSNSWECSI